MNGLVRVRQEEIGNYDDGGALFTFVDATDEEEVNLENFVLTYIDSDDDVTGVAMNAAYAHLLD
jgi:hypothetical protein